MKCKKMKFAAEKLQELNKETTERFILINLIESTIVAGMDSFSIPACMLLQTSAILEACNYEIAEVRQGKKDLIIEIKRKCL